MAAARDAAVSILRDLVAFDTTSHRTNLGLITYVRDVLAESGVDSRLVPSDDGRKANLFATIGANRPGGVVLSGHTDVVPVEGQDWSSDPFAAEERGGRIYGRGTADMKGFIACTLAAVPELATADLKRPVHLAFSYDEEVGCLGVGRMIDAILSALPRPAAVIVGEPTSMRIAAAHKGICAMTTTVRGREAHSSRPQDGVNAIAAAADFVSEIYRIGDALAETGCDDRFDPPFTSFNVGSIEGGDAINIIARECVVKWEFRPIPGADPDAIADRVEDYVIRDLLPRMQARASSASIDTVRDLLVPPFEADDGSPAVALARRATGDNDSGTLAFVTEASLYAKAGLPAVICGPGDIAQAHQADEFIALEQIDACLGFLSRVTSDA
jgi:acetylornithine deacetylase